MGSIKRYKEKARTMLNFAFSPPPTQNKEKDRIKIVIWDILISLTSCLLGHGRELTSRMIYDKYWKRISTLTTVKNVLDIPQGLPQEIHIG